jgi:Lipopolysaccharide kinase (Kdo/WaaP) family
LDHIKQIGENCVDLTIGKWRGKILSEYEDYELISLFASDDFPSQEFPGKIEFVHSNIGQSFKATTTDGVSFFVKSFDKRKVKDALKSLYIPMEAARSWKASWVLEKAGIAAPAPVGVMEQKQLGTNKKTVYIARNIVNAQSKNLRTYFDECFDQANPDMDKVHEKRLLIKMLGDFYRQVHQKSVIYFPDFHPHNFVLGKDPKGKFKLYIVDFDEVKFNIRNNDIMKNLSSLGRNVDKNMKKSKRPYITTGDRLRFIKAYLGEGKNYRAACQKLWKDIIINYQLK